MQCRNVLVHMVMGVAVGETLVYDCLCRQALFTMKLEIHHCMALLNRFCRNTQSI